jgi:GNAT superfamily N-acetyltransferase
MLLTTRRLVAADWAAFWPLLKGMGTDDEEPTARERYTEFLHDPRWAVFGAVDGSRLVGYAAVQDYGPHLRHGHDHRTARLHDLYVHPDERRRGAGKALVEAAIEWAAQRVRYLEWQAHHERSAPFYQRLGYRGEPCPQPDYPTFEVDFRERRT